MQLNPYRLIYANAAANREALSSCWSEANRDRYLLALFRDGVYLGDGGWWRAKKLNKNLKFHQAHRVYTAEVKVFMSF